MQLTELVLVLSKILLQMFNLVTQCPLIRIKCRLQVGELFLLVFCFIVGLLNLLVQCSKLATSGVSFFNKLTFLPLACEVLLLVIFQGLGQISQILS